MFATSASVPAIAWISTSPSDEGPRRDRADRDVAGEEKEVAPPVERPGPPHVVASPERVGGDEATRAPRAPSRPSFWTR